MKRFLPPTWVILFLTCTTFAQENQWIWVRGDNNNDPFKHGTLRVSDPANEPKGRYEGAAEWVDKQGNFWLYGGTVGSAFGDLWKYDRATNEWTWMHGADTAGAATVRGTKGISDPANTPGVRYWGSGTWVDTLGNLWLFGGRNFADGSLNDLWKFDPSKNEWTWMHGPSTGNGAGVHGTKGVSNPNNVPGARHESPCTWVDDNGDFWLFGGEGRDGQGQIGNLSDLWKYSPTTNEWTWVSGDRIRNQQEVYGTKGISSPANKPGARSCYSRWKDKNGRLWLFGGGRIYGGSRPRFNDVWMFDINTEMWTWMSGDNTPDGDGVYGPLCVPSLANIPRARYESRTNWTDECGNFWLFGGFAAGKYYNDLWRFNPTTLEWTWMHGSQNAGQTDIVTSVGLADPANTPGSRMGASTWSYDNELWLYGGGGFGTSFNILWKYKTNDPPAEFTTTPTCGDAPLEVDFNSKTSCSDGVTYEWDFGDPGSGADNTSTLTNPNHNYVNNGTYTVTLIVTNCAGKKDTVTDVISVGTTFIVDAGADPTICNGGSTQLNVTGNGTDYSWSPSTGLSDPSIADPIASPDVTTTYIVTVSNSSCSGKDTITVVVSNDLDITVTESTANGCDRGGGNSGSATVEINGGTPPYTYSWNTEPPQDSVTAVGLIAGTYTVTVTDDAGCTGTRDITIEDLIQLDATVIDPSCGSCNDGEATVNIAGNGAPPFTFRWSPGDQTTATVTGLSNGPYTVTVTDTNGCFTTLEVEVGTVGITDNGISLVKIFPNPAKGKLFISGLPEATKRTRITVYNVSGKIVWNELKTAYRDSEPLVIEMTGWSNGIYLLDIQIDKKRYSNQFILNNN